MSLKNIAKIIGAASLILFIVVIIAAGFLWLLARPEGNLRLAIQKDLETHKLEIANHYHTAASRLKDIYKYHEQLSLKFDSAVLQNPVPGIYIENTFKTYKFSDYISIKLIFDFKDEKEVTKFSTEFNMGNIAELMYKVFKMYDFYLVVASYEETKTRESAIQSDEENLIKMVAQLFPIDKTSTEIPGQSPGPKNELENGLAFYIYECFWAEATKKISENLRKDLLSIEELSKNRESLEHTSIGFKILEQGSDHSECTGLNPRKCRLKARDHFKKALSYDYKNAHASFGLGIVSLGMAIDAKKSNSSAYIIGTHLLEAGQYIYSARKRSTSLRKLTDSQEWQIILKQWPDYKDLRISNKFIDTVINYKYASEEFAKADYTKAIGFIAKVEDIPPDFKGLLRSLEYEAKLYLAKTKPEAHSILKQFRELSLKDESDPGWRQSYAFHACRFNIDTEESLILLDRAIDDASDFISSSVSLLLKGQCLVMAGRHEQAKSIAEKIKKDISDKPGNEEYMGIYLDLGYLFALLKDYKKAAQFFIEASKLWDEYINNIRNAPDLEDFRNNGKAEFRWFKKTIRKYYYEKEAASKD